WIPPVLEGSKPELGNDSRCDRLPTKWSTRYATRKRLTSPRLVTRKHRPPFTQSGSSSSSYNSPSAPRTGRYSHRGSTHPTPAETSPLPSTSQPFSFNRESLLRNQCEQCGRVLSSKAALQKHVGLHSGKKLFSCSLCSQIFPDPQALTRHGRVHRNGKIYICPQCNEGFAYRFGLTQHLQMVHSRIKPFVCHICQKSYFWRKDFESHFRVHSGTARQFPCNLCDKRFNRRVELEVHLRSHSREKRHWCPYCGKEFLDYSNLKRHKYTHTGERPYACAHCTKSFVQSGHLKKHLRNVHKVDVYADLKDFESHFRVHTGTARQFPCNLCDKRFNRRVELVVHLRSHSRE
uniref:C2H2-type domain-containing protein n=1 Tax=Gadus morhua TaxID=8049 RepID=A0A8C4ZY36_GADMO